jgi:hypothetical protein
MTELRTPFSKISGNMALAAQSVAIGHQTFKPYRPTRRQGLGADANFCAKSVAETISEAG